MNKKLILTSFVALLSACDSGNGKVENMIPKEIDGQKVYTDNDTKLCGQKNKDGNFIQRCLKDSGEFLTGVIYFRHDLKDVREEIDYYNNGWRVKFVKKENGIVTSEENFDIDEKNDLQTSNGKSYFDNGNLHCEWQDIREIKSYQTVKDKRTCYYIDGVLEAVHTMDKELGTVENLDYDREGKLFLKGVKAYEYDTESDETQGIEKNMYDKWVRYDANGDLFNGTATFYLPKDPTKVSSNASIKNGKLDGESHYYHYEEIDSLKEEIDTYKNGVIQKIVNIYKDETRNPNTIYFAGDNSISISFDYSGKASVFCRYKNTNASISISGAVADNFVKKFEQDTTKSLCPDISSLLK